MRVLIANWSRGLDLVEDRPDRIRWNDGTSATINDYIHHLGDTNTLEHTQHGWEMRMFPEIVAKAWYDAAARTWVVGGEGIPTESLGLSDPDTPDEQIRGNLSASPIAYKAEIIRESA